MQCDWRPYKERKEGYPKVQREDYVKTQGEGSYLQTRERGHRRNPPCQHLDLAPQNCQKEVFVVKLSGLWHLLRQP